jgi:hypothetical protein
MSSSDVKTTKAQDTIAQRFMRLLQNPTPGILDQKAFRGFVEHVELESQKLVSIDPKFFSVDSSLELSLAELELLSQMRASNLLNSENEPRDAVAASTALLACCLQGSTRLAKYFLGLGADPQTSIRDTENPELMISPLHTAIYSRDIECVRLLLEQPKVDVNRVSPVSEQSIEYSPMQWCCMFGTLEIFQLLMQKKAKMNEVTEVRSLVVLFGLNWFRKVIRFFIYRQYSFRQKSRSF